MENSSNQCRYTFAFIPAGNLGVSGSLSGDFAEYPGRLALGGDADLVIFDPDEEWTVDPEQFASKGRNTPFGGHKLKGKVKYTIVGGRIVYQDA